MGQEHFLILNWHDNTSNKDVVNVIERSYNEDILTEKGVSYIEEKKADDTTFIPELVEDFQNTARADMGDYHLEIVCEEDLDDLRGDYKEITGV